VDVIGCVFYPRRPILLGVFAAQQALHQQRSIQSQDRNDANTARFPLLQPTGMKFVPLRCSFVLQQATRGSKIDTINRAVPGGA
jgi:hypothetical protein